MPSLLHEGRRHSGWEHRLRDGKFGFRSQLCHVKPCEAARCRLCAQHTTDSQLHPSRAGSARKDQHQRCGQRPPWTPRAGERQVLPSPAKTGKDRGECGGIGAGTSPMVGLMGGDPLSPGKRRNPARKPPPHSCAQETAGLSSWIGRLSIAVKIIIQGANFSVAVWPWASYLTALYLSSLTCKNEIIVAPPSLIAMRMNQLIFESS